MRVKSLKFMAGLYPFLFMKVTPSTDIYGYLQKKIIAQKAISHLRNGMFILTSGGTTIIELAKALPPDLQATFISAAFLHFLNIRGTKT